MGILILHVQDFVQKYHSTTIWFLHFHTSPWGATYRWHSSNHCTSTHCNTQLRCFLACQNDSIAVELEPTLPLRNQDMSKTTRIDIIYIHCYIAFMHFRSSNCMKYSTPKETLQHDFNHDHAVTATHPLLPGLGFSWSSGFRSYLLGKAVKNLMKRPKLRPKVQEIVEHLGCEAFGSIFGKAARCNTWDDSILRQCFHEIGSGWCQPFWTTCCWKRSSISKSQSHKMTTKNTWVNHPTKRNLAPSVVAVLTWPHTFWHAATSC